MKTNMKRMAAIALAGLMLAGLSLTAEGASSAQHRTVQLTAGSADTVDLGRAVADVLVANPSVADVGTLRSSRLYVVGKAVGDTNILAFDDQGNQMADIDVHVRVDEGNIRDSILKFFPGEDIDVRTVKNDIVLTGVVSTPSVANQVRDLASRFVTASGQTVVDLMRVAGEQQVMLKVKVIEARRSILREYGFEADLRQNSTNNWFDAVGGTGLQSLAPFGTGQVLLSPKSRTPFELTIRGLEKDGLINILAEPNLTAISGETAGFLAGGEFPVPSARDKDGNVTLEFKKFGVALNFTPTVLAEDRIALQLSTEVSAKSDDDGVTLVNTHIPGLTVRRAETTVQMGSGGTLMIAGLIKSDDVHSMNGFPGIQDVPVLGELFKSKSFSRNESELLIMVTPYLVKPYDNPQVEEVSENAPAPAAPTALSSDRRTPPPAAAPLKKAGHDRPLPPPPRAEAASYDPLSEKFIENLRKVYGNKVPQKVATDSSFGYIID